MRSYALAVSSRATAISEAVQDGHADVREPWAGQLLRFALTGGGVALLYVATTTALSGLLAAPFQLALVIGFSLALLVHFTLQRVFVWAHEDGFALPVRQQI